MNRPLIFVILSCLLLAGDGPPLPEPAPIVAEEEEFDDPSAAPTEGPDFAPCRPVFDEILSRLS